MVEGEAVARPRTKLRERDILDLYELSSSLAGIFACFI